MRSTSTAVLIFLASISAKSAAAEWPQYRNGVGRTAFAPVELPNNLAIAWVHRPSQSPCAAWPSPARGSYWQQLSYLAPRIVDDQTFHPVVAGGRMFFASSADDTAYCLDSATGEVLWRFTTDGPVRYAPAVTGDRVFVGSDDGCLYALSPTDGTIVWKRRLAPEDRRIPGNGRMISAWPVRTGVLVDGEIAYAVCGLFPSQGVFAFAIDAKTGDEIWRTALQRSAHGYLLASRDRLFIPTGRGNPIALDRTTGKLLAELGGVGGSYAVVAEDALVAGRGNDGTLAASDFKTRERLVNFRGTQMAVAPKRSFLLGRGNIQAIDRPRFMALSREINRQNAARDKIAGKIEQLKKRRAATKEIEPFRNKLDKVSQKIVRLEDERSACKLWETAVSQYGCLAASNNQVVLGGDSEVVGLDSDNGRRLWRVAIDGVALGIAISDGFVVVSTKSGELIGLSAVSSEARSENSVRIAAPDAHELESTKSKAQAAKIVRDIRARRGIDKGFCLVLGAGPLGIQIAKNSELQVVVVDRDKERVDAMRRTLAASPLYGSRIAVHLVAPEQLPFTDHCFTAIIQQRGEANDAFDQWPTAELKRLVSPGRGMIWSLDRTGQVTGEDVSAAVPAAGAWTHQYGNPANTANSGDRSPGGDLHVQWFGGPGPSRMIDRHLRGPAPLVADGRMFIPAEDKMIAVDAYNGTELWQIDLPRSQRYSMPFDAGYMTLSSSPAALMVAVRGEAWQLDVDTGERLGRYTLPSSLGMPDSHWGYLAAAKAGADRNNLRILGSAQKPTASRTSPSRGQIDVDYRNGQPIVTSDALFSVGVSIGQENRSDRERWVYRRGVILNPTITFRDDESPAAPRIFFVESRNRASVRHATGRIDLGTLFASDAFLVALDERDGRVVWERPLDSFLARCRNILFLQFAKQKGGADLLIATGSYHGDDDDTYYRVAAFDAATGAIVWKAQHATGKKGAFAHGEQVHHPVILDRWIVAEPAIYELATGKRANPNGGNTLWSLVRPGHSCGTMSGAGDCLFFRADNPTILDLAPGLADSARYKKFSPTRPGCWINIIPAGGLILVPEASASCVCSYPLQTSIAFLATGSED